MEVDAHKCISMQYFFGLFHGVKLINVTFQKFMICFFKSHMCKFSVLNPCLTSITFLGVIYSCKGETFNSSSTWTPYMTWGRSCFFFFFLGGSHHFYKGFNPLVCKRLWLPNKGFWGEEQERLEVKRCGWCTKREGDKQSDFLQACVILFFFFLFVLFLNSLVDCFHILNVLFPKQTIVVGVFLCEEVCCPTRSSLLLVGQT